MTINLILTLLIIAALWSFAVMLAYSWALWRNNRKTKLEGWKK